MDTIIILQKTIESLRETMRDDIKEIKARLDYISNEMSDYKVECNKRKYKCLNELDHRYIKISDLEIIFKLQLEKHYDKKLSKKQKGIEHLSNILHIVQVICPYVMLVLGYILLRTV